jgi:hypothetical protein
MPIVGVTFKEKKQIPDGILIPANYIITLFQDDSAITWEYVVTGARFDKKKIEFTPVSGRNFEIFSGQSWKRNIPKERIYTVSKLRLIGEYSHSRHGADAFLVSALVFNTKSPVTPKELINQEMSRQKTPYM